MKKWCDFFGVAVGYVIKVFWLNTDEVGLATQPADKVSVIAAFI